MRQFFAIITNYWGNPRINTSLKVFIALSGVVISAWLSPCQEAIVPLVLGVIASAIAETDDNLSGKRKAFLFLLLCATIASVTTQLLFYYPVLFAVGFFCFSFSFIMLGAIGPRYASIAFSSILLSIYTMIGYANSPSFLFQPLFLLTGIIWYALVALFWQWCRPLYPVQNSISHSLSLLGAYFKNKSELFIPLPSENLQKVRLSLAKKNAKSVAALEQTKETLLHHADKNQDERYNYLLKTFFLIQDIHERGSSSHLSYEIMAKTFPRSDIMFRFQHLIYLQGKACAAIAQSINTGKTYIQHPLLPQTLKEAQTSLNYLKMQNNREWLPFLPHLEYLLHNLKKINRRLLHLTEKSTRIKSGSQLADDEKIEINDIWPRIRSQLRLSSPLFRHALRLSLALCIGYGIIQGFHPNNGYWIMLTTLFVCRQNFSSTRIVFGQRILGTFLGLVLGFLLLFLFADLQSQVVLMVIAGVIFFAAKDKNYTLATLVITLLVLFCFNQSGQGFAVIMPRLGDTLLGAFIAVIASSFFFPDWASLHQKECMQTCINANQDYLAKVITQYRLGKKDNLSYRIARRNAHKKDAKLSKLLSDIELEPQRYKKELSRNYRFLTLNHSLLNYISALGAHRQKVKSDSDYLLIKHKYNEIRLHLEIISQELQEKEKALIPSEKTTKDREPDTKAANILFKQLEMILQTTRELLVLTVNK